MWMNLNQNMTFVIVLAEQSSEICDAIMYGIGGIFSFNVSLRRDHEAWTVQQRRQAVRCEVAPKPSPTTIT